LRSQLEAVDTLQADVLCLQELYCTASAAAYRTHLPSHHLIIHSSSAHKRLAVFFILGATTTSILVGVLTLCAAALEVVVAAATVAAALYCIIWQCMLANAATPAWLTGHAGGVAILVRKSILKYDGKSPVGEFEYFDDQGCARSLSFRATQLPVVSMGLLCSTAVLDCPTNRPICKFMTSSCLSAAAIS
jgi:hypothetical protein